MPAFGLQESKLIAPVRALSLHLSLLEITLINVVDTMQIAKALSVLDMTDAG